ncbi:hypothetical protein K0M31_012202 [Melipona bicolor]|uniref:Uncharacterized protein n=1 Tax=Melipona bicolor TaxID=60889 RepID=A0AA40KHS6_9HYME|nr:hypothetical protein K0M31_012202 [Melipona bicolor]
MAFIAFLVTFSPILIVAEINLVRRETMIQENAFWVLNHHLLTRHFHFELPLRQEPERNVPRTAGKLQRLDTLVKSINSSKNGRISVDETAKISKRRAKYSCQEVELKGSCET